MKSVVILGMGKSGQAAYAFLKARGYAPFGIEEDIELMNILKSKGFDVDTSVDLKRAEWVVVSPGVPPSNVWYQKAVDLGKEIVGEAELALRECKQPVIAVTGTNGKTTVTLLIAHVLNECGKKVKALGNIGTPLTEYFLKGGGEETLVIELSSYQLETLHAKCVQVGVILNITPDHLDRHSSMEEYAEAKCRLARCLLPGGTLYVNMQVLKHFGSLLDGEYRTFGMLSGAFLWTDKVIVKRVEQVEYLFPKEYHLLGVHECENVLAAWAACSEFGIKAEEFLKTLETFKKPKHRIEKIAEIEGVLYVDDSKGTNVDATIHAVQAMRGDVILIAGGVDKGASYEPWKESFLGKVKLVLVIGEAAEKIKNTLSPDFSVMLMPTLQAAVEMAKKIAQRGEVVLLSPGCSSFDMFRDYVHRGEEFRKSVIPKQN